MSNTAPPLHEAAANGQEKLVKRLLAAGAATELRSVDGRTALHCAADVGAEKIAAMLLAAGANADAVGSMGGATAM